MIERLISIFAPHYCFLCGKEDTVLCMDCIGNLPTAKQCCLFCSIDTTSGYICKKCSDSLSIKDAWVSLNYDGVAKELVAKLKYKNMRAASDVIAVCMASSLPQYLENCVVVHIPTVSSRIRQRGYDQAALIASKIANIKSWTYASLIIKTGSTTQTGQRRSERLTAVKGVFDIKYIRETVELRQNILLVDDVLTTGSSIREVRRLLKDNGYTNVYIAVFAHSLNKNSLNRSKS